MSASVRPGGGGDVSQPEWTGALRYAVRLAVLSGDASEERASAVSRALAPAFPGGGGGACGARPQRGVSL